MSEGAELLAAALSGGDRGALARAITLVESTRDDDRAAAGELLDELAKQPKSAHRIGITGVPGVGKSTFVDSLGCYLVDKGHRVAVLAVDPSSSISRGSILGDKSRMGNLASREEAFIRPSPSGLSLGGVARRTREAMLLVEAAGYDVVLVETVGVGQSETVVEGMVDFFLVLMLAGAGDELQGIKRGIVELADVLAVNKADGDNEAKAKLAAREYGAALRYLSPKSESWKARVCTLSALHGHGLAELWELILEHRRALSSSGELDRRRSEQRVRWMWSILENVLVDGFRSNQAVRETLAEVEAQVASGELSAGSGAARLLGARK